MLVAAGCSGGDGDGDGDGRTPPAAASSSHSPTDLRKVQQNAGGQWRSHAWRNMPVVGGNVPQGSTMLGVVGFSVSDAEKATGFELCGPTKASPVDTSDFACVPISTPERGR
jgi:hypothetical protein